MMIEGLLTTGEFAWLHDKRSDRQHSLLENVNCGKLWGKCSNRFVVVNRLLISGFNMSRLKPSTCRAAPTLPDAQPQG